MTGEEPRGKAATQEVALARLHRKLAREARAAGTAAPGTPVGDALTAPTAPIATRATPATATSSAQPAAPQARKRPANVGSTAARPRVRKDAAPLSGWRARVDAYERLIRLDKPIGWMLLLWPTLTALWMASWGRPTLADIVIFVTGTILMRSAGCALNDWADRDFDGQVKRTATRPLATGEIAPREALIVAAVLAACAFALVCFTNRTTILLSLPALAIAVAYPFVKRFFALPQAFLGIAFSFGIPMAFAAEMGRVPLIAWILLVINLFWVIAYDTEYAMVDRDDDVRAGIHTSAITFGRFDVLAVALCYAMYVAGMAWVGFERRLGVIYFIGLTGAAGLAVYHLLLIRGRDREACFRAFRHNAWFGATVFAGTVLALVVKFDAWPTLN